jgi:pyruvate formate lyase activating enzyme
MCHWIRNELGDDVPLHFSAFHPDYLMMDTPPTPRETLVTARDIAIETGLKYVYIGNVRDPKRENTYCAGCGKLVVERHGYELGAYHLDENACRSCGHSIPGHFADQPGQWGARRIPVDPAALLRTLATESSDRQSRRSGVDV